ncbi:MAG TPA: fibronectin type III domain-containing protein, partial [Chitinispirillaceae bacterium]|nr:fibronectin type III domain-containing protein [Chitinispirillaceae bacterium]
MDFKLNNNLPNAYVGFGVDLKTNLSPVDLSTVIAIQFDVKSSIPVNVSFRHLQTTISDYNYYRKVISPTNMWTTVIVQLDTNSGNLHQESWGARKPLDLSKTRGFEWIIDATDGSNSNNLAAALSIDNVKLIGTCSAFHSPYPSIQHYPKWKAQNVPFSAVRFEWFPASGADSYTFQCATDSLFTANLVSATAITDTSFTATNLKADTLYYWRVKTIDGAVESNWSYSSTFSTAAAPMVPEHIIPVNNAINVFTYSTLRWHAISGAESYHVQVDTTLSFSTSLIIDQEAITADSLPLPSLERSTTYYWKVRAKSSTGYGNWSTPWKFTTIPPAPSKVTLVTPRKDSVNTSLSLQLGWNPVPEALSYYLQVSKTATFSNFILNQGNVTTAQFALTTLENGTQYFWRVAAVNNGGTGEWSDTSNFTTIPAIPQTPIISTPTNGATGVATTVTIQWNEVTSASSYDVTVSGLPDFTDEIIASTTVTTPSYPLSGLSNNKTYYVRVCAKNMAGTSSWSANVSFTTVLPAPSIPEIVAPADNATGIAVPGTLIWKKNSSATSYSIQVATNEDFATVIKDVVSQIDTLLSLPTLTFGVTYFWHVKAHNAGGSSNWTTPARFTTIEAAPAIPAIVTPVNNAVNVPVTTPLVWNKSIGSTSFALQVATSADFSTKIKDTTGIIDTLLSIETLQNATIYFWKIKAINTYGESDWSITGSFTTIIAAPTAPEMVMPSNNATDITVPVSFIWRKSVTATSYEILVATDEGFSSTVKAITNITDTITNITDLLNGTSYFWKVKAVNVGGSNWSTAARFSTILTAPGTPEPVSPSNNSTNLATSVSLTWKKTPITSAYSLQVATDDAFTSLIKDTTGIVDTTIILTSLNNSTTYFWRLKALNNGGASSWSVVERFSTIIAAPGVPELSSPQNNSTNVPVAHALTWNKCLSAATYSIQLSKDNAFSTIVLDSAGIADTTMRFASLSNSTDYFWHVKALNDGGSSGWSVPAKFTTIIAAPATPVVQLPSGGTTNVSINTSLSWNSSPSSTGYSVQIATDSLFTSLLVDSNGLADTTLALKNVANDTRYFWRVKALNIGGQSEWSTTASFITIVALPSKVTMNSATLCDTTNADSTNLSWFSASPKIIRYQLEFSTDSTMSTVQVDSACTDTFKLIKNLANGTTYWWRVRAGNAAGWGEYSEKQVLKVFLPGVAVIPSQFKVTPFSARGNNKGIKYALPEPCRVSMVIYNVQGVLITKVLDKSQPAGIHFLKIPALPSGTYYISFKAG